MRKLTEAEALARLQRSKVAFQTHIKLNFEHRAVDCRACPTPGVCCTDAHFVNVNITRLEAVAVCETIERTPRLTDEERRAVYARAREAVGRYGLKASGDTFAQTYSCPLFVKDLGCLVHRRPASHLKREAFKARRPTDVLPTLRRGIHTGLELLQPLRRPNRRARASTAARSRPRAPDGHSACRGLHARRARSIRPRASGRV